MQEFWSQGSSVIVDTTSGSVTIPAAIQVYIYNSVIVDMMSGSVTISAAIQVYTI